MCVYARDAERERGRKAERDNAREQVLGASHVLVANTKNNIAGIYLKQVCVWGSWGIEGADIAQAGRGVVGTPAARLKGDPG